LMSFSNSAVVGLGKPAVSAVPTPEEAIH
jgi:hypothetical protein